MRAPEPYFSREDLIPASATTAWLETAPTDDMLVPNCIGDTKPRISLPLRLRPTLYKFPAADRFRRVNVLPATFVPS
eukprot:768-Pelagococcus_subviridis.AAC.1